MAMSMAELTAMCEKLAKENAELKAGQNGGTKSFPMLESGGVYWSFSAHQACLRGIGLGKGMMSDYLGNWIDLLSYLDVPCDGFAQLVGDPADFDKYPLKKDDAESWKFTKADQKGLAWFRYDQWVQRHYPDGIPAQTEAELERIQSLIIKGERR